MAQILGKHPRIDVVGSARGGAECLVAIAELGPEAVLLDMAVAGRGDALRTLIDAIQAPRVVAFGVAESEAVILEAAEAGVLGYVRREASVDELVTVLEAVMRDELVCSPRVAGTLLRRVGALARERTPNHDDVRLTARETQIVGLVEEGLSNKQIAQRLQIELPTVKNHVHHILEKLGVSRRGEAVARVRVLRRIGEDRILATPRIMT